MLADLPVETDKLYKSVKGITMSVVTLPCLRLKQEEEEEEEEGRPSTITARKSDTFHIVFK